MSWHHVEPCHHGIVLVLENVAVQDVLPRVVCETHDDPDGAHGRDVHRVLPPGVGRRGRIPIDIQDLEHGLVQVCGMIHHGHVPELPNLHRAQLRVCIYPVGIEGFSVDDPGGATHHTHHAARECKATSPH